MNTLLRKSNSLINRILAMDAETGSLLKKHDGRVLALAITGTRHHFYITIINGGVCISDVCTHEPDVTVRGTPQQFMAFIHGMSDGRSPAASSIEIAGDIGLAQELQSLMKHLEPDWEEYLSHWLGDTPARKLANLIRQSGRYFADVHNTLRDDISEYLRFEAEILPDRSELEEFNAEVDILRDDVERLRLRIDRLQSPGKES